MTKELRGAFTFLLRASRTAALLSLWCTAIVASELPFPTRPWQMIAADAEILGELARMALLASSRVNETEVASFLIRRADGRLALERWPDRWERNRQTWRGKIPAGAIAIVHTHPDRSPRPSREDCELARSTGLAVVTLSRWAIWGFSPDDSQPRSLVLRRNWTEPSWLAEVAAKRDPAVVARSASSSEALASRNGNEARSRDLARDREAF